MFSDIEDFRNYRSFCDEENIAYYSFRDPTVKPLSVVIKDIPTSYSEEAIEAELLRLKYPVTKVSRLYNKERKPIHICAVELTNNSEARKIFALNKFLYSVIRVEQRFNARIVMCKKCQRYGHSQANCGFPPRCVKCVGNHHYKDCGKTRDSLPQCVNCNEYHAANYRGCKYYKTYVKEKTMPSPKERSNNSNSHISPKMAPNINDPQNYKRGFPSLPRRSYREAIQSSSRAPPLDWSSIISNIVSQVVTAIVPQIQKMVEGMVRTMSYNG